MHFNSTTCWEHNDQSINQPNYIPADSPRYSSLHDKYFIQEISNFNVCCSYDEVVRFRVSAASAASEEINIGLIDHKTGLAQAVFDNFDADIFTANCQSSTYVLVMLITQTRLTHDTASIFTPFNAFAQRRCNNSGSASFYCATYKPSPVMPVENNVNQALPPNMVASQVVSLHHARDLDSEFFKQLQEDPDKPEHGGFNTRLARW